MSNVEARWVPIDSVIPYDNNPRIINEEAVKRTSDSLSILGQGKPILVSLAGSPFADSVICCGHTTTLAALKLGWKNILVREIPFRDEAQFVDMAIRDNKSAEYTTWDSSKLINISSQHDVDIKGMGFDISSLISEKEEPEVEIDDHDECPTCGHRIKSKNG